MSEQIVTTIRISKEAKDGATIVLDKLGLSLSASVNLFLIAVAREQGLPFDVSLPESAIKDEGQL